MYAFFKFAGLVMFAFGIFAAMAGRAAPALTLLSVGGTLMLSASLFEALAKHLALLREQVAILKDIERKLPRP